MIEIAPRLKRHGALLGCLLALLLAVGSLAPNPPSPQVADGDKLLHLLGYGSLSLWWALATPYPHWRIGLGAAVYGALLEVLQGLTGYRSFDLLDMVANALGAGLGLLLAMRFQRRRRLEM